LQLNCGQVDLIGGHRSHWSVARHFLLGMRAYGLPGLSWARTRGFNANLFLLKKKNVEAIVEQVLTFMKGEYFFFQALITTSSIAVP
jgi:hypothetical protein